MTMTTTDIRAHADQLQGRLEIERKKVATGEYGGHPSANLHLIDALEGRIKELLDQCDAVDAAAAVPA